MASSYFTALMGLFVVIFKFSTSLIMNSRINFLGKWLISWFFDTNPSKIYNHNTLTCEELTSILSRKFKSVSVKKITPEPMVWGASNSTFRLHIEYNTTEYQDVQSQLQQLPKSLILKEDASTSLFLRFIFMILGTNERECNAYKYLADSEVFEWKGEYSIVTPIVYAVRFNNWSHSYMIIMEDVSKREGFKMLSTTEGAPIQVYKIALKALAKWQVNNLTNPKIQNLLKLHHSWLDGTPILITEYYMRNMWNLVETSVKPLIQDNDLFNKITKYAIDDWINFKVNDFKQAGVMLCHADYRFDNMAINVEEKKIILFDWQITGLRTCLYDVLNMVSQLQKPDVDAGKVEELLLYHYTEFQNYYKETTADEVAKSEVPRAYAGNFEQYLKCFKFTSNMMYAGVIVLQSAKRRGNSEKDKKNNVLMDKGTRMAIDLAARLKSIDELAK